MADLNIALILRLVDRATGPAREALRGVERASNAIGNSGLKALAVSDQMLEGSRNRMTAMRGEAMGLAATAAGLFALTEPAIQAERRMAEVGKAVSFMDDENGLRILQEDIQALVTSGGLLATQEGIMDIVAAAGRMGVVDENLPDDEKRRQLLEFAEAAAMMAAAFNISADVAGETLARWRMNLGLTQEEAMLLGDTVNLLGNTMATNEADILSVLNRQAVLADVSGLATSEIAALSATLLAAGSSPEIAATGMKNFVNALTRGASATDRQKAVYKELGLDATEMARRMQEDAGGAMLQILEALNEVDAYRQSSLIGDLFGEEAKSAIAPLIAQTDTFRTALEKTADAAGLMGLMEEEYNRQAATTHAQRQKTIEYLKVMSNVIGAELLPMINELLEAMMPLIQLTIDWVKENPEVIRQLGWVAVALFGMKAASLAVSAVFGPLLYMVGTGVRVYGIFATSIGFVGRALTVLARVALAHPLLLLATAIAVAAYAIYANWDEIVVYFQDKVDRVKAAFDEGLINGVFAVLAEFNPFLIMLDGAKGLFEYLTGYDLDPLIAYLKDSFLSINFWDIAVWWVNSMKSGAMFILTTTWGNVINFIEDKFDIDLYDAGVRMITTLRNGVMSMLEALGREIAQVLNDVLPDWAKDGILRVDAAIGPNSDAGVGDAWRENASSITPGRALGGGVRAGSIYEVNEQGRELFRPGVSGSIITARDARGVGATIAQKAPIQIGDIHVHPAPGMDELALARAVGRELDARMSQSGALHDGGFHE